MNFWQELRSKGKPIMVLAPMADVTDAAFRRVIAKYGKPDIFYTEFVSADGLVRAPEGGRKKLLKDLEYTEAERPIVAQLFTSRPEYMKQAAALARELGFDGIDINMGCPDQNVNKQGAGAALIRSPESAQALIAAAKEGARGLPISVKTRLGWNRDELETWLPALLSAEPAAVIVHARTRKEMSKVPARWERVKKAVEIRDEFAVQHAQGENERTLILGNGDARDIAHARELAAETGADGVMLGRAIFGNPWLFADLSQPSPWQGEGGHEVRVRSVEEKLTVMVEHTKLFEELLGGIKNFNLMKKHYKAYVKDFDGATELRGRLMEAKDAREVEEIVDEFLHNQNDGLVEA